MSLVQRNIIANLLGGTLLVALSIIITPLQINLLGIEAFGIVSFIATLQIAFTAFDLGLSSTLTRELAADLSVNKLDSVELLRTASTIYWCMAALIGLLIVLLSGQLASRWFNARSLDSEDLKNSLQVIALYLALRWPVSLYIGVLIGLQRMDILNVVKVVTAAIRLIGGIVILLRWRSLHAFLMWTAVSAVIEVAAFWCACRLVYPSMPASPGLSIPALRRVWRFSLSMNALMLLTMLVVQMDRLLISKLLTLEELGAYSLAYSAAAIIPALISATGSAVLPSFAATHSHGSMESLIRLYGNSSRFLLYTAGLIVSILVFFGELLLSLWVSPSAAAAAAPSLAVLAVGFWGSAVASNAYQLSIAAARPHMALRISALSAPVYVASLYLLILWFGILGAAVGWLLLNLMYVVVLVPMVHRNILRVDVMPFFLKNLGPFVVLALATFGLGRLMWRGPFSEAGTMGGLVASCTAVVLYLGLGYFLLGREIRALIASYARYGIQRSTPVGVLENSNVAPSMPSKKSRV